MKRLIILLLIVGCAAIPEINTQEHVDGMDKLQLIFEKLEDKGKIVVIGIGKGTRMDEAIKSSSLDAERQLNQQVELYKKCYDDSKPMVGSMVIRNKYDTIHSEMLFKEKKDEIVYFTNYIVMTLNTVKIEDGCIKLIAPPK